MYPNHIMQRSEPMPLIEVHLLEGRTDEQKKALLQEITRAVHESIGIFTERIYGCRRTLRRQKMNKNPGRRDVNRRYSSIRTLASWARVKWPSIRTCSPSVTPSSTSA
ncbi:MAG: tautomerase family protein [Candidatus Zixiibacteriota bacterium]